MKCDKCGLEQLIVKDSRPFDWGIKRKRVCLNCGHCMPTIEINEITDQAVKSLNKSKKTAERKETRNK